MKLERQETMSKNKSIEKILLSWVIPVLLICWWFIATRHSVNTTIFPAPGSVFKTFIQMVQNGQLVEYTSISTKRALLGLLLGGGIGLFLAILTGVSKFLDMLLNSTMQMLRTVPVLAMISLMIIWFGIGEKVKVYMVALGVFFPIYINTYHGIKTVDRGLLEMGKVYGLNDVQMFVQIIFPHALSSLLVGLRLSLGSMWMILVAAETIATDAGIGYMAMNARELMQMDKVVISILIYAVLGKLSDVFTSLLERILLRWREV
jgi:sulfonate transport system permease protein